VRFHGGLPSEEPPGFKERIVRWWAFASVHQEGWAGVVDAKFFSGVFPGVWGELMD